MMLYLFEAAYKHLLLPVGLSQRQWCVLVLSSLQIFIAFCWLKPTTMMLYLFEAAYKHLLLSVGLSQRQ
jgi:hypothetical protein